MKSGEEGPLKSPRSVEAEKAVLGAIFVSPEQFHILNGKSGLKVEHFFVEHPMCEAARMYEALGFS